LPEHARVDYRPAVEPPGNPYSPFWRQRWPLAQFVRETNVAHHPCLPPFPPRASAVAALDAGSGDLSGALLLDMIPAQKRPRSVRENQAGVNRCLKVPAVAGLPPVRLR